MVKSAEDIRIEKMIEDGATRIAGNMIEELKRQLNIEGDKKYLTPIPPKTDYQDKMKHAMTIGELRDELDKYPDGTYIIMGKDGEGNGFSPLAGFTEGIYLPENTYSGDVFDTDWSASDCDMEEDEWATMKEEHPVSLTFYPIN